MITIAFTGDIAFSGHMKEQYKNLNLIDSKITEFLSDSDYTVANVEGAITDRKDGKTFHHSSPAESVGFYRSINATVWNLANNHSFDFDIGGIKDTVSIASENNVHVLGVGTPEDIVKPLILGDNEIGIVSVTYDGRTIGVPSAYATLSWNDNRLSSIIKQTKNKCRHCVVVVHGGDEFSPMPLPYIRSQYLKYLKYGADIIVGHHPHVVQNYETVGDKVIFYSIGNFVFDTDYQRSQKHTEHGILLKIKFDNNGFSWSHISVINNRDKCVLEPSESIGIFIDIGKKDYGHYWPLAAKHLEKNENKIRLHLNNINKSGFDLKRIVKLFTHLRLKKGRYIFFGIVLSRFQKYNNKSSVYKYIIES